MSKEIKDAREEAISKLIDVVDVDRKDLEGIAAQGWNAAQEYFYEQIKKESFLPSYSKCSTDFVELRDINRIFGKEKSNHG